MKTISTLFLSIAIATACTTGIKGQGQIDLAEFAGRYSDGKDFAVYFEPSKYGLTIRPVLWTATQLLRPVGFDNFEVVDRTSHRAAFVRDQRGKIVGVKITGMDGEGMQLIKAFSPKLPVERLLD